MIKFNILGSSNRSCGQNTPTETETRSFINSNHRSLFYITLHLEITCNYISTYTTQLFVLLFLWLFLLCQNLVAKIKWYWYDCEEQLKCIEQNICLKPFSDNIRKNACSACMRSLLDNNFIHKLIDSMVSVRTHSLIVDILTTFQLVVCSWSFVYSM